MNNNKLLLINIKNKSITSNTEKDIIIEKNNNILSNLVFFDFIEKVIYINLEKRTDRKESIEKELLLYFPPEKIIRFNAISENPGYIGCSKSHIGAIKLAIKNNWNNCLIVEDDMIWNDFDKGYSILTQLIKNKFDIILFGATYFSFNPKTLRLNYGRSRTAYLISQHYYKVLLKNFEEGLNELITKKIYSSYGGDVYWRKLQEKDNWFIVSPALSIQKNDYSDIQNRNVDYKSKFNII